MADSYLLVKGEDGKTLKVKLVDIGEGLYALAVKVIADDS